MFGKKEKEMVVNVGDVNMYTIFDRIAGDSCPPFCAKNDGVALRSFHGLLKDVDILKRDEYQLFQVGTYNPEKIRVEVLSMPREVIEAVENE